MNELIKITETNGKKVVSARELHAFLELDKSQISRWLKTNITNNDFLEMWVDYTRFDIDVEGQYVADYAITIDTAKRLALKSNSKKGEDIRTYFIECEKQLLSKQLPQSYKEALIALIGEVERRELAEQLNQENAPKVAVYELAMSSNSTIDIGEFARVSQLGYGRNTLFKKLRDMGILMKNNVPYQNYITDGYFTCIEIPITVSQQTEIKIKTLVTQKGVDYLIKKLK